MQIEFFNFLRSVVQTEDGLVLYALALIVSMEIIDFVTGTIAATQSISGTSHLLFNLSLKITAN
ncbi:putative holin 1 [Streptococcus pneumoniae]|nr:putative holin 1 [Streptococcus pneumoniae]CJC10247.1 putative holin 1 [Streptococcus pneumoniae]